jgi:hypothetical protein
MCPLKRSIWAPPLACPCIGLYRFHRANLPLDETVFSPTYIRRSPECKETAACVRRSTVQHVNGAQALRVDAASTAPTVQQRASANAWTPDEKLQILVREWLKDDGGFQASLPNRRADKWKEQLDAMPDAAVHLVRNAAADEKESLLIAIRHLTTSTGRRRLIDAAGTMETPLANAPVHRDDDSMMDLVETATRHVCRHAIKELELIHEPADVSTLVRELFERPSPEKTIEPDLKLAIEFAKLRTTTGASQRKCCRKRKSANSCSQSREHIAQEPLCRYQRDFLSAWPSRGWK